MQNDQKIRVFVVEDDPYYTQFLVYVMGLNPDIEAQFFTRGTDCLASLHLQPHVVTLDYGLPDLPGEDVLAAIRAKDPSLSVIIISAQEKIDTAVELLKAGAFDYVVKNEEARDRILNSIRNAAQKNQLAREVHRLRSEVQKKYDFQRILIGESEAMKRIFELMEKAAQTQITVSITGETGTGKDLVAKAIHYNSARKNGPFVAVNVAAIPRELIESELFGHERGAFTGAIQQRIGKFEEATGGTLFLDEIGELDISLQAKLLRALQEREISRVGGNRPIKLDVRVLVATHRDLRAAVEQKLFREDLYYRLLGFPISLPPLRERGHDALLLAHHFLTLFCNENDKPVPRISEAAQDKLMAYPFPGNVRELKSVMELAAVMASSPDHLEPHDLHFRPPSHSLPWVFNQEMSLAEYNLQIVRSYLNRYNHNVTEVAQRLQIGKSSIYRYLKEMEPK